MAEIETAGSASGKDDKSETGFKTGTGVSIRRLTRLSRQQLEQLCCYGSESLGPAALGEWMLPVIAKWGMLFIAESAGEIIGSAQSICCVHEKDIYMDIFYIRPGYRLKGYGRYLLEGVKERLGAGGFKHLLATIDPGNQAAVRLYESAGFHQLDHLNDFYGAGRHRRLMAANLEGPSNDDEDGSTQATKTRMERAAHDG